MWYVYMSHLSEAWYTDEELDDEDLVCETCGDFDYLLDTFKTEDECKIFLENFNKNKI